MISNDIEPQITAIIPTYKRPQVLVRAIKSVLNQTYPNVIVCVCDNASGDETRETVLKIADEDPRVIYHCHDTNIGAVNNFNSGLDKVKTPFFSFLSDDNVLLSNFYEDAIKALNKNPKAVFFAGQTLRVTNDYKKISGSLDKWKTGFIQSPLGLIHVLEKGIPIWEGVLFRNEVIKNVGILNPYFKHGCDQDFMMRIARYYPFYVSKKPCALFFVHDESWSANRQLKIVLSILIKKIQPYLFDEELPLTIRKRIKRKLKISKDTCIRHFVFNQILIGKNNKTLHDTLDILKYKNDLSFKVISLIRFAELTSYDPKIQNIVSTIIKNYVQLKRKLIFLKSLKNYKDNKYIPVKR